MQEPARAFSSFPFGWPLLLAMAVTAGVPAWLVNPVLGVLTLGLVWALGTRLYGGRAGVLAAAVIGMTPFFLFNAASSFSHPLCGVLLLGAAVAAAGDDRRAPWVPLVVGLLIGWAVVARYLTGVICGVPIGPVPAAPRRAAGADAGARRGGWAPVGDCACRLQPGFDR